MFNELEFKTPASLAATLYGVIAFAIQVLYAPFITFFVDFSSRQLNISWIEFVAAQLVYGMWNSVNEFVFGYHSDVEDSANNNSNTSSVSLSRTASAERRLARIQKWGLLWACSFCVLWVPVADILDQHLFHVPHVLIYTATLVLYGGCFAYVTVQHRALLVDIAEDEPQRQRCTLWASVLGGIGSLSVVAASAAYSSLTSSSAHQQQQQTEDAAYAVMFRWVATIGIIASIAALLFHNVVAVITNDWKAAKENAKKTTEAVEVQVVDGAAPAASATAGVIQPEQQEALVAVVVSSPTGQDDSQKASPPQQQQQTQQSQPQQSSLLATLKQISASPPMRTIYIVWLLQELCCYVLTTFLVSAVTEIVAWVRIKEAASKHNQLHTSSAAVFPLFSYLSGETWITLALGVSFIIPQVVLVGLLPLVRKHGLDYVVAQLFRSRILLGAIAFLCFCHAPAEMGPIILIISLLSLRLVTECVCRLQPLILAALSDEHPPEWTASLFGAASLGSKPSQSLAPVLGYALLREIAASNNNMNSGGDQHHPTAERVLWLYGWLVGIATVPTAVGSLICWQLWPLQGIGKKARSALD